MHSLNSYDDIGEHEIDRMYSKPVELGNFDITNSCPLCGRKGRLVYHNDYVEELKCKKDGTTWQREKNWRNPNETTNFNHNNSANWE